MRSDRQLASLSEAVVANDPVPCLSEPDIFFPEDLTPLRKSDAIESAKKLCAVCPVMKQCADYAIAKNESYGIWGGTTSSERAQFKRKNSSFFS